MRQARQLNWCGHPMEEGESYYGGRPEQIREGCPAVPGAPANASKRDRREIIGEDDVAAIFKGGPLTKAEAVRQLEANTGASRASCYRAIDQKGRFAKHLRYENGKLSWR
jgi:hypothetical protein